MEVVVVALFVAMVLLLVLMFLYSKLVRLQGRADLAWEEVDEIMRERVELVPNLVNYVKGYERDESPEIEAVTEAYDKLDDATEQSDCIAAYGELEDALKALCAETDKTVGLKKNKNFQQMKFRVMKKDKGFDEARRSFDEAARLYNEALEVSPTNTVAKVMRFKKKMRFADEKEQ